MKPRPWPELQQPTPEQWLDWLLSLDHDDQLHIASKALALQDRTARCWLADHDSLERELRWLQADRGVLSRALTRTSNLDEALWLVQVERAQTGARLWLEDLLDDAWARYGWVRLSRRAVA